MTKLKNKIKKNAMDRLKEENFRYVSWVKDLVNIVHNSDIAMKELVNALKTGEGESVVEMERVDQLLNVYEEVLETFTYDSEESKEVGND